MNDIIQEASEMLQSQESSISTHQPRRRRSRRVVQTTTEVPEPRTEEVNQPTEENVEAVTQTAEINTPSQDTVSQAPPSGEQEAFSEDDINDILNGNGFLQNETSEEVNGTVASEINDEELENLLDGFADAEESITHIDSEEFPPITPVEAPVTGTNSPQQETRPPQQLPLNSPTLLLDESTSRFSGAEWYKAIQQSNIILAGLGGIGSWTALQLARMHPARMVLYDDDVVERVNMSGQLYSDLHIGMSKVSASKQIIEQYAGVTNCIALDEKFEEGESAGDIMICGFDNMVARKTFFNAWKERVGWLNFEERQRCLFIDGRLSIDTLQVLCIRGDDTYNIERYEKEFLFSDEEAEHTVCSMKQTTYLACMISSFIVNLFTNHIANLLLPVIPYDMPFFTEYDAQNMLFRTEL